MWETLTKLHTSIGLLCLASSLSTESESEPRSTVSRIMVLEIHACQFTWDRNSPTDLPVQDSLSSSTKNRYLPKSAAKKLQAALPLFRRLGDLTERAVNRET
jgi:hypothetical protein